jgi:hypothetical protein
VEAPCNSDKRPTDKEERKIKIKVEKMKEGRE